jgi:hypothetical protein
MTIFKTIGAKFAKVSRITLNRLNNHRTTDAYLIGYPKCGNTWLQVMLGKYVHLLNGGDDSQPIPLFSDFDQWGRCTQWNPNVPRIQFTHGGLEWTTQTAGDLSIKNLIFPYRKKKIALLVRNIPDMLISLYWHYKTRITPPYEGEVSDFIRSPLYGVDKAIAFYRIWHENHGRIDKFILLRYEDIRKTPFDYFKSLLAFWDIPVQKELIEKTVEYASFDNMRKLENANRVKPALVYASSGLPIFTTGDTEKTTEAYHVRKGLVGGYREYLSQADIDFLKERMRGVIPDEYGYPDGFPSS